MGVSPRDFKSRGARLLRWVLNGFFQAKIQIQQLGVGESEPRRFEVTTTTSQTSTGARESRVWPPRPAIVCAATRSGAEEALVAKRGAGQVCPAPRGEERSVPRDWLCSPKLLGQTVGVESPFST
jgi:hypothetical protein